MAQKVTESLGEIIELRKFLKSFKSFIFCLVKHLLVFFIFFLNEEPTRGKWGSRRNVCLFPVYLVLLFSSTRPDPLQCRVLPVIKCRWASQMFWTTWHTQVFSAKSFVSSDCDSIRTTSLTQNKLHRRHRYTREVDRHARTHARTLHEVVCCGVFLSSAKLNVFRSVSRAGNMYSSVREPLEWQCAGATSSIFRSSSCRLAGGGCGQLLQLLLSG